MKTIKKSKIKFEKGGFYMKKRSSVITIPRGTFHISIEELRNQLRGGGVNVGKNGITASKAGSIKVPEGTFHARDINGGINNLKNFFGVGDDLIEKARETARGIYQTEESPSTAPAPEYAPSQAAAAVVPFGRQWYEADPERFAVELSEMESRGFERIDFYDGRIGFKKLDNENKINITVICDWLYPLKPPALYVSAASGPELKIKKNPDGSLALLSKYMSWRSDMAACTMIDYFEEKLEMLKDLRDEDEEFGPAGYEKAEVPDAVENQAQAAFVGGVNESVATGKESRGYNNNAEEWDSEDEEEDDEDDDDDEDSENGSGQILKAI